jgi:aspartate/methionine/tyrosine aminotransferase
VNVVRHLLQRAGVVVTPGVVFGKHFDRWVRLAAVVNEERMRDVVRAIRSVAQEG